MEQQGASKTESTGGISGYVIGGIVLVVLLLIGAAYLYVSKNTTMPAVSSGSSGGAGSNASTPTYTSTPTSQIIGTKVKVNDYVTGEAINKRQLSNYAPWVDLKLDQKTHDADQSNPAKKAKWDQYGAYWGKINELFGDPSNNEPYVTGFMKGMNLALKHDLVAIFKDSIQQYLDNPAKLPHWEVTKAGQFLN